MATILVDYENVCTSDGLKGLQYLNKKGTLIIFFSQSCERFRADYVTQIEESQCEFKIYKLSKPGKNALDFYIATECGYLSAKRENQICIISKDKGFTAIADFFQIKSEFEETTIISAPNIESALQLLNEPEEVGRKRLIEERKRSLSIESEYARIKEHREFVKKVQNLFEGTSYETKVGNILKFVNNPEMKSPRRLYTSSLHEFGREDGRAIYNILKQVV